MKKNGMLTGTYILEAIELTIRQLMKKWIKTNIMRKWLGSTDIEVDRPGTLNSHNHLDYSRTIPKQGSRKKGKSKNIQYETEITYEK